MYFSFIVLLSSALIYHAQVDCSTSKEVVPEVNSKDSGSIEYNLLLLKLELLEDEFRARDENMQIRLERMNKQILESLHELETTITHRLENIESTRRNLNDKTHCDGRSLLNQNDLYNFTLQNKYESLLEKSVNQLQQSMDLNFSEIKNDVALIKTVVPPKSCNQLTSTVSGKFWLQPFGAENTIEVFCEQKKFGGGWLIFQHRFDGSEDFFRNWTHYKYGFGSVDGEFWLGLEYLHRLTSIGRYELIVELEANNSTVKFARYDDFAIGSEQEMYALKRLGNFSGTAPDALSHHKGKMFSTMDKENGNCPYKFAKGHMSAWWYYCGYTSDLNQPYVLTKRNIIYWGGFPFKEGLKSTKMMIREIEGNNVLVLPQLTFNPKSFTRSITIPEKRMVLPDVPVKLIKNYDRRNKD